MISFLRGTVAEKDATSVVMEVSGVGFECGVSARTAAALPGPGTGETCVLFTKLQVRDDGMFLFGFSSRDERDIFEKLVAVSGVGPKMALSVLGTFDPAALFEVVASGDEKRMATVPGVGKKTASRMILELKDAFKTCVPPSTPALGVSSAPPASALACDEAASALLSMGFTAAECELALKGYDGPQNDTSAAIRFALKRLGS